MINFNNVTFERVIIHRIYAKAIEEESASCQFATSTLLIDEDVENELIERIKYAFGYESKSFKLKIADITEDSFYYLAVQIFTANEDDFINLSMRIANRLAGAQRSPRIPGGFLIIIKGIENNTSFLVTIKAELQNAFTSTIAENGRPQIELIKDLFLSPAIKFYKMGLIYEELDTDETFPNSRYACHIFDDQFRPGSEPAEYFYNRFLGFSISENEKLVTKDFHDEFVSFAKREIESYEEKNEIINTFRSILKTENIGIIDPEHIGNLFFANDPDLLSSYGIKIRTKYPHPFIKSNVLLDFTLKRRKVDFPGKVKIEGPEDVFNSSITIYTNPEEIVFNPEELGRYTYIKVFGLPYEE